MSYSSRTSVADLRVLGSILVVKPLGVIRIAWSESVRNCLSSLPTVLVVFALAQRGE